jgi:hypothetical protein
MHTKEEVGLFLLAREDGMSVAEAAAFAGVGGRVARSRDAGMLPRSYTGRPWGSGRIGVDEASATRGGARVKRIEIRGLYEPPETGPLAQMTSDQIEKLLLRAVLDDLKGGGSHPLSTPMRSRCELGERLRRATGLPTSAITRFLEIPRSTWYYHRAREGRDRGGRYRWPGWVAICEANGLTRSMSRKGTSGDNARADGFFGLLKQESFYAADWAGASLEDFMRELDAWMRWFREGRISRALGWLTPDEHRLALGHAV